MTPERTNEPSTTVHETARLPKSPCTDGEVAEMVARLNAVTSLPKLCGEAAGLLISISAERDTWKLRTKAAIDECVSLTRRAERAEAERDALKARVAEVLEPFAKANDQWLAIVSPDLPDGHELNVMGSTVGHFRRASELHATLSGERT